MSSSSSITVRGPCNHTDYSIGCVSCEVYDTQGDFDEAKREKIKREEAVEGYQALLKQADVPVDERKRFEDKLKKAEAQRLAWDERCRILGERLATVQAKLEDVCKDTDPNALNEKFRKMMEDREHELEKIWRSIVKDPEAKFSNFVKENPERGLSIKGLDRSNIPATPDSLVREGIGLQLFQDKKEKQSGESSTSGPIAPDSFTDAATGNEGGEFGNTVEQWEVQREERKKSLIAKLKEWKAPEGFDDGSSNHPDPRMYYDGPSLAVLDMKKLEDEDYDH